MIELGIIGGLSPYSTILYYKAIVEEYRAKTGKDPWLIISSISVQEMCSAMGKGDLSYAASLLLRAINALKAAGANRVLLAANTPHAALRLLDLRGLELIDIVEPVAKRLAELGARSVGLLATSATIKFRVYHDVLEPMGIHVLVPGQSKQALLDDMVERIASGENNHEENVRLVEKLVDDLSSKGADAVILGCTELSLYRDKISSRVPVIDSLREHVVEAVRRMTQS